MIGIERLGPKPACRCDVPALVGDWAIFQRGMRSRVFDPSTIYVWIIALRLYRVRPSGETRCLTASNGLSRVSPAFRSRTGKAISGRDKRRGIAEAQKAELPELRS